LKGIKWIVYTDISRDGTLEGPNYEALKKLSAFRDMNIVFSGGVSSLEDIKNFKKNTPFLKGIIIGKALYEKRIELKEALTIFEKH
jgi:phosphoribosylformimino-5-aminoimidazole carboxamide ribotide isomerase